MFDKITEEILEDLQINREEIPGRLEKYPQELPLTKRIPFGYTKKGGDPYLLVPDPVVILFLDVTLDQLDNGTSYRIACDYLNSRMEKHGYDIRLSHQGLSLVRRKYRPDAKIDYRRVVKLPKRLSREERFKQVRKQKIANAKREIIARDKKIKRLQEEINPLLEHEEKLKEELKTNILQYTEIDYSEVEELGGKIIQFKPNPGPQTSFLQASELQVLYGGSAGGGKSFALLADPMRYFDYPNFRGLLLRKTLKELGELKWKSRELYKSVWPKANFRTQDSVWVFPSGAELSMSYLDSDADLDQYQGQSYCWIGFDELTHWSTPNAWNYLYSRLRSTDPFLSQNLSMRATTNPGGPGHGWVKKMFIDPSPPGRAFWATDIDTGEVLCYPENHHREDLRGQPLFKRRFIPAKLSDNPHLFDDGRYETALLSLPENQRRQLLEGDWSVADGAAFSEFRESIHVCEPFEIPTNWRRFRSMDWGYSTRQWSAVHWFAIAPDDTLYVYREMYFNQKTPREAARMIMEAERYDRVSYGVLDANAWNKTGQSGPSIAEEMIRVGCRWRPADNKIQHSRAHGANRLHEVLRVRETPDGPKPGIIFFNNCRKIISTLPILPQDPDGSDDIDQDFPDDHAYDSVRYGVMSRPRFENPWVSQQGNINPVQRFKPMDPVFGY